MTKVEKANQLIRNWSQDYRKQHLLIGEDDNIEEFERLIRLD